MGLKNGKYQAASLTPNPHNQLCASKNIIYPNDISSETTATIPIQSSSSIASQPTQTGNLIITIRMLTMNSNEVNQTTTQQTISKSSSDSCVSSTNGYTIVNSNNKLISKEMTGTHDEIVDQSSENNQNNNATINEVSSSASSVCKKFNSKYNQTTIVPQQHQQQLQNDQQQQQQLPIVVVCDSQNNVNNTNITTTTTCNNQNNVNNNRNNTNNNSSVGCSFRLSSCPFADKISNMLVNKCRFNSSSSSSNISGSIIPSTSNTEVPLISTSSKASKMKKGLLGKFKSAKQKKNRDDTKISMDDASSSLNSSNASSSSYGSDKVS